MVLVSINQNKQNKTGFFTAVLLRIFNMFMYTETPGGKRGMKYFEHTFLTKKPFIC